MCPDATTSFRASPSSSLLPSPLAAPAFPLRPQGTGIQPHRRAENLPGERQGWQRRLRSPGSFSALLLLRTEPGRQNPLPARSGSAGPAAAPPPPRCWGRSPSSKATASPEQQEKSSGWSLGTPKGLPPWLSPGRAVGRVREALAGLSNRCHIGVSDGPALCCLSLGCGKGRGGSCTQSSYSDCSWIRISRWFLSGCVQKNCFEAGKRIKKYMFICGVPTKLFWLLKEETSVSTLCVSTHDRMRQSFFFSLILQATLGACESRMKCNMLLLCF